jgi:hypothetical protein
MLLRNHSLIRRSRGLALDHNPYLKPWREPRADPSAGKGYLEDPSNVANMVWQTRADSPSEYESAPSAALIACFEAGIEDLNPLVEALNERGVHAPDGRAWDVDSFAQEISRLGY